MLTTIKPSLEKRNLLKQEAFYQRLESVFAYQDPIGNALTLM